MFSAQLKQISLTNLKEVILRMERRFQRAKFEELMPRMEERMTRIQEKMAKMEKKIIFLQ